MVPLGLDRELVEMKDDTVLKIQSSVDVVVREESDRKKRPFKSRCW